MNIYVVVEGDTEDILYRDWIPRVNPELSFKDSPDKVMNDDVYIVSGRGYPFYFSIIDGAVADVEYYRQFDRLVISVDSEDMSYQDKHQEILDHVGDRNCRVPVRCIVQHFCLETWALGNRKIVRPSSRSQRLHEYRQIHDVRVDDPALLPPYSRYDWNRAAFAYKYLVAALNDRFKNLSYSKRKPEVLMHRQFFGQLQARLTETGHIGSFSDFLDAFAETS